MEDSSILFIGCCKMEKPLLKNQGMMSFKHKYMDELLLHPYIKFSGLPK
jgi:hypothetical protein